jgi:hypothetical protein
VIYLASNSVLVSPPAEDDLDFERRSDVFEAAASASAVALASCTF